MTRCRDAVRLMLAWYATARRLYGNPGDARDAGPLDIPNDWTPTPKRAK